MKAALSVTSASVGIALFLSAACQPPPPGADEPRSTMSRRGQTCESTRTSEVYAPSTASIEASHVPDAPVLPERPLERDGAFTVWGAQRRFRARPAADETISVIGYVVKTNFRDAPPCALAPVDKRLPADCRPPTPTLWLGDAADQAGGLLPVKGFASSFANLLAALKPGRARPTAPTIDSPWGRPVPRPLPARGAKMRVTGVMAKTFTLSSDGAELYPAGVLTYASGEYLEPPSEPAKLGQ